MDTIFVPGEILQKAFPGLGEGEAREIIQKGQVHTFLPGVVTCKEGALETTFYIILSGEVQVSKVINESEEK
ncbi:MAG: hypothetical protein HPY76_13265, partial [Anaerolineae bacterium]|nr:hypothetical protein [Anaerolineae bacterium]